MEYEKLREQRRRFEAELEKFNRQQALEEKELHRMASDLQGVNISSGHQSEPTTPPEYRDHAYPSLYTRRNRYSSSSLVSPQGISSISNRLSRSGSQLVSPLPEPQQTQSTENTDKLPSKSVPGSRRGSTDRVSSYLPENSISSQRSGAKYVQVFHSFYPSICVSNACMSECSCTLWLFVTSQSYIHSSAPPLGPCDHRLHYSGSMNS